MEDTQRQKTEVCPGIQYRVASIALHLGTDSWTYLEGRIRYSTFHTVGLLVLALSLDGMFLKAGSKSITAYIIFININH